MPAAVLEPREKTGPATPKSTAKVRDTSKSTTRRGRPRKEPEPPTQLQSEYEKARISEISTRARFYRLKVEKLEGELLDRKIMIAELTGIFGAIREIILASDMTTRQKSDCLRNLTEIPIVVANVAAKQKEDKDDTITQNGGSELN